MNYVYERIHSDF
jgi:hypothetical protein